MSGKGFTLNFFLLNFFPIIFFWFIWICRYGRPLILKLIPNAEEWNYKIARFFFIGKENVLQSAMLQTKAVFFLSNFSHFSFWDWAVILGNAKRLDKKNLGLKRIGQNKTGLIELSHFYLARKNKWIPTLSEIWDGRGLRQTANNFKVPDEEI